eukprot:g7133.t1
MEDRTKVSVESDVTLSKGSNCRSSTEVGGEQLLKKNVGIKVAHGHLFKRVHVYEMRSYDIAECKNVDCAIKEELRTHGFVKISSFLDKAKVTSARLKVLEYLHGKGMLANENSRLMSDANLGQGILLTGYKELCDSDTFGELFDSKRLKNILGEIGFNSSSITSIGDKGIRVIGKNEQTAIHADGYRYNIFLPYTMYNVWIPLNDIVSLDQGPLMLCDKSHLYEQNRGNENNRLELPQEYVDKMIIEGKKKGSEGEKNVEIWYSSSNIAVGDIIVFDGLTIHGSCANLSKEFRLSCDYRYVSKEFYDKRIRHDM